MKICEAITTYRTKGKLPYEQLDEPCKVANYMKGAFHPFKESVWIIPMTAANVPICREKLTEGTLTASLVSIRDTFKAVLKHEGAVSFILVHNHPSGKAIPSKADDDMTRRLKHAAKIIEIGFLDHCIIGDEEREDGFYSYTERNSAFQFCGTT